MDAFSVTCETCRARLKVRSAGVIGQIHACPKCGSMVQIAPPPEWQQPVSPPGPLAAAGASTVEPIAQITAPAMEFVEPAAPPAPVAPATTSFMLGAVGGAALLLAGGLVIAMWRGGEDQADAPLPVAAAEASIPLIERIDEATARPDDPPIAARDAEAVESAAVPANEAAVLPQPPALPELPAAESEPHIDQPPAEEVVVAQLPSAGPIESSQTDAQPAAESRRAPVLKFDPLDFDPSQLSLAASAGSGATPAASSIPDDADGEAALAAVNPADDAADETLLPPPARGLSLAVRLGPMPSDAPPPHQLAHQLALPIQSLEITDMPLARFVEVLSDMADVPITLDPMALELAGVSPRQAVSVQASDVTLEQVLLDVLSKLRLEFVERDGQVIVTMAGGERRRAAEYDVQDLVGAQGPIHVAELIERFVAPEAWRAGSGTIEVEGATLRIDHVQSIRHEALIFCERLRLARGLPFRSRYPAALLSIESPSEQLAATLKQSTTFTFLPWTRLADVVRHWQDATGLTLLVDWPALADLELDRSSPVACSAIDRTWEQVLDGILEPLGLTWWAVDGETIQITTREALDDIQRIEFYAVPIGLRDQFASGDALVESLERELRDRSGSSQANTGQPRLEIDEPSGRLIVLGSPDVHRYLTQCLSDEAE